MIIRPIFTATAMRRLSSNTTASRLFPAAIRVHVGIVVVFICYVGIVALIASTGWSQLPQWLAWWSPTIEVIGQYAPALENVKRSLSERGFGHRVVVVQHLMMAAWLFLSVALLSALVAIFSCPSVRWKAVRSQLSPEQTVSMGLLGSIMLFAAIGFWMLLFGENISSSARLAFHKYDLPLFITIMTMFGSVYVGALSVMLAIGAFLTGRQKSRREWDDGDSDKD